MLHIFVHVTQKCVIMQNKNNFPVTFANILSIQCFGVVGWALQRAR